MMDFLGFGGLLDTMQQTIQTVQYGMVILVALVAYYVYKKTK